MAGIAGQGGQALLEDPEGPGEDVGPLLVGESLQPGENRGGLGKRDLEKPDAAADAARATGQVAGKGPVRSFAPKSRRASEAVYQSIDLLLWGTHADRSPAACRGARGGRGAACGADLRLTPSGLCGISEVPVRSLCPRLRPASSDSPGRVLVRPLDGGTIDAAT